jgi:serine/threonine-protein kinase
MQSENLTGRTIAGYHLVERVGEGGTAEVYRATWNACPVRSRIAWAHSGRPQCGDALLREAGYGARVNTPERAHHDYGEAEGQHYLALEWAAGKSLAEVVQGAGRLPSPLVGSLVRQLGDALGAAHRVGIIHRDLKPENIMYDEGSATVKLLDFGIARDADLTSETRLTRTGYFVGTLQYVAPEALSGELVDGRADLYSLATITYYMLTGRHPFTARRPSDLFNQLLTGSPEPLGRAAPDLTFPAALEAAVMRGLARDPAERQPTVTAFAAEFVASIDTRPPTEPGLLDRLRHIGRRHGII